MPSPRTQHTAVQETSHQSEYISQMDFAGTSSLIYFGLAIPGSSIADGVWQIRKFSYDGLNNLSSMLYANGALNFDAIWNSRAALSYS